MMTNSENLRDIVCDLLLEIEREQAPSHVAIRRMLEKYQYLGSGERGFISRLTRGTLERRMTLDWMIDRFSSVRVKKMKPVIRTILRMSVYQIKYMDGVPESAVCNEAVKLAKKRGFKNLSGFVNGILRNMIRNPEKSKLPEDNLSIYYSQPEWLVDYWTECYGRENTIKMLQWFLEERPLTVDCVNIGAAGRFYRRMEAQGVTAVQSTLVPGSIFTERIELSRGAYGIQRGNLYCSGCQFHVGSKGGRGETDRQGDRRVCGSGRKKYSDQRAFNRRWADHFQRPYRIKGRID